jgi:ribosomal 30S subunit maturation factor RimM
VPPTNFSLSGANFALFYLRDGGRNSPSKLATPKAQLGLSSLPKWNTLMSLKNSLACSWLSTKIGKPHLEEGEFLLSELLGMNVVTETGEAIGEVLDIMESPAHDLLVTERGLIPMRREFIKEVDKHKRQIVVNLPKGLISEEVPKKRRLRWQR